MIRRTIDYQWNTLSFFHDAGHVGEQAGSQPWRQVRDAILRGKDDMNEQGSGIDLRPVPGLGGWPACSPRLAPWAKIFRPPGWAVDHSKWMVAAGRGDLTKNVETPGHGFSRAEMTRTIMGFSPLRRCATRA